MTVIDVGMGEPIRWTEDSFTEWELRAIDSRGLSVGDVVAWRNDLVKVVQINPLIVEEIR